MYIQNQSDTKSVHVQADINYKIHNIVRGT